VEFVTRSYGLRCCVDWILVLEPIISVEFVTRSYGFRWMLCAGASHIGGVCHKELWVKMLCAGASH